jgi:iron uptake system component EfeO
MRGVKALVAVVPLLVLAGCSSGGTAPAGGAAGSTAAASPPAATTPAPPNLALEVQTYRSHIIQQAAALQVDARRFTDALRAGNLAEAKKQFAPSRFRWEAIEPIALLVSRFDIAVDARVDDYASPSDPQWTGWHKLEYLMWVKGSTAGTAPLADKLDRDLAKLAKALMAVQITPAAAIKGASDLVAEVSDGKITGEEDRYSHTDLSDFAANVSGAKAAYTSFRTALADRAPQLASAVDTAFSQVEASLAPYKVGGTYKLYQALAADDKLRMQAHLSTLSESLAAVPGALSVG